MGVIINHVIYVDSEEEKQEIIIRIKSKQSKEQLDIIRRNLNMQPKINIEKRFFENCFKYKEEE